MKGGWGQGGDGGDGGADGGGSAPRRRLGTRGMAKPELEVRGGVEWCYVVCAMPRRAPGGFSFDQSLVGAVRGRGRRAHRGPLGLLGGPEPAAGGRVHNLNLRQGRRRRNRGLRLPKGAHGDAALGRRLAALAPGRGGAGLREVRPRGGPGRARVVAAAQGLGARGGAGSVWRRRMLWWRFEEVLHTLLIAHIVYIWEIFWELFF